MRSRLAVLPSALLATLAPAQEPGPVPTFPSQVDLVTVDAVVLDAKGDFVRGLTADDFLLFEDGRPQVIASFEAVDTSAAAPATASARGAMATNQSGPGAAGRPFVLLVDDMSLAPSRQEDVRKAIVRFLREGLRDGDELIFATTSGDVWWGAILPDGREDLEVLAGRVRGRNLEDNARDAISDWEAYRIANVEGIVDETAGPSITERVRQRFLARLVCDPLQPVWSCRAMVRARAQRVDGRRRNRTRDVLAAVDRAVFALTGVRGRKSLLLLTEGFLSDPGLDVVQEVAGRCREANIAVYSLDVRGLVAGLAGSSAADAGMPSFEALGLMRMEQIEFSAAGSVGFAEDTGGFAVRDTNDFAAGAMQAAMESRVHYLLGYTPPADKGPLDWRKLKVEVKRPGLRVRARKGYALRTAAEIAAAAEVRVAVRASLEPPVPADVARALSSAHRADAIPLRAIAYVLEERPGGTIRTLIAVEADIESLANLGGDEPRATLSLSIAATHRDTGKTVHVTQLVKVEAGASKAWEGWLVLARELDLPPGVSQARVVVRDPFLGRLGALTLRFVVPPLAAFRSSTPLLTDRVTRPRDGGAVRPALVARREFAPSGPLYCQFEVFGASRVEAAVELRRREGEVVRPGTPALVVPGADGRLAQFVALPIAGIAEGDYELVIRLQDLATGRTSERIESLRITNRPS